MGVEEEDGFDLKAFRQVLSCIEDDGSDFELDRLYRQLPLGFQDAGGQGLT